MKRFLLVCAALAALPTHSRSGETVVRLAVRPVAAPKPALKYLLLPEVRELNSGNPAQWYVRCFAEQRNFFFTKEANADRARYLALPLAEVPAKDLRTYGGSALRQVDWGARLDAIDWQVLDRVQNEGMDLMLSELAPFRVLATALRVRFRGQVAGRHFDDAIVSAKTMFAFARHLGEYPTEAANLVGLSVAEQALAVLDEMVQQPGCPNLYWAFTDLPCPLVELRKGVQGDCTVVATDLKQLRGDAPMTEPELEKVVGHLSGVLGFSREQAGQAPRSVRSALAARVKDAERVRAARGRLVEGGAVKSLVEKFPPLQAILLDEKRDYEARRDEAVKLLGLAPYQIDALPDSSEARRGGDGLFADLLPHVLKVRLAQARMEQRIALLRYVEALRMYAAGHDGKLPEKLADCPVPLPADPFTGKPFAYKVEAQTAHLTGAAPRGEEQNPSFNLRYEVTVRK